MHILPRRLHDPSIQIDSWESLEAVATRLEKPLDQLLAEAGTDRPNVLADFAAGRAVDLPIQTPRTRKAPAVEQLVSSLPVPKPRAEPRRPLFPRVASVTGAKSTDPATIRRIQRLAGLSPTEPAPAQPDPAPSVQEEDPEEAAVAAIVARSPRLNLGSRYRARGEGEQGNITPDQAGDPEDAFVASIVRHSPRLNAGSKYRHD